MRSIATKLVIVTAITAIGMFASTDSSIGTWQRNVAESKTTPAVKNPITSLTIVNEAGEGGVRMTVNGERQDGTVIKSGATVKYDGKDYPVAGAPWDTISMKQIDANTFTSEAKMTGGKYHVTSRTVISNNGKTMTTTTEGTNAEGEPLTATAVYDSK